MKKRQRLLQSVFAVLWLAIFFMLTNIVLFVSGRNIPKSSIDIADSPHKVRYSIDSITVTDSILKDIDVTGWSFIESNINNEDKEVFLIFLSDNKTYQVRLNVYDRGDLPAALPELIVPKRNSGFMGSFSPLAMKNGLYRLYIFNKENHQFYGIADTGKDYLVKNGVLSETSGSEELKITNPDQQAGFSIQSSIDSCVVLDNILKINGWAFVEGTEAAAPLIKIKRSDGVEQFFTTSSIDRPDVAKYFGKTELAASGFRASIPMDEIGADEFTIWIFFEGIGASSSNCVFPMQEKSNN